MLSGNFKGSEIQHGIFLPRGGGGGGWWLIFGPRIFWVLLEPLGMFLGFDFCPPFNHP